jgi:type IV secretion system protein TrbG
MPSTGPRSWADAPAHSIHRPLVVSCARGCATFKPPEISYDDDPRPALFQSDPPKLVEVVEIPKPLPLPGQLKAVPGAKPSGPEPKDPTDRVAKANEAARVQPTRNSYINAVQVYPTRPAPCTRSIPPPDR